MNHMRKKIVLLIMVLFSSFILVGCGLRLIAEREVVPFVSRFEEEQLRIQMIADVEKSVVVVKTETGHGSGIIFKVENAPTETEPTRKRYSVLTNQHVVEDGGEMRIHFGDDSLDLAVVDYAEYKPYDIAVVRFTTTRILRVQDIIPLRVNPDDANKFYEIEILKGQDVYAIGTPKDIKLFNYVTKGIVSLNSYPYNGIQFLGVMHNAELNPGNSGGPLFNSNGDVIGINVAKVPSISTQDGVIAAEGLNYALSINKIANIIRTFNESSYTKVERKARLGISVKEVSVFLADNSPTLLPDNPVGVVVVELDPTRFAKDYLKVYDLIIRVNLTQVTSIQDLSSVLGTGTFGDNFEITVMRKVNGEFVELTYTIALS